MPLPSRVEPGHLQANENQNERQAITQQVESRKGAGEKKIHRAEAQNGEHVRCVDDQRLAGDRKDRGNGIDGEKNIGRFDEREHQENRRSVQFSVPSQEEPWRFRVRRHGQQPSQSANDKALFGLDLTLRGKHNLNPAENQENTEQDHDPTVLEQFGAENDEDAAEDQRTQDAVEQNAVL